MAVIPENPEGIYPGSTQLRSLMVREWVPALRPTGFARDDNSEKEHQLGFGSLPGSGSLPGPPQPWKVLGYLLSSVLKVMVTENGTVG